MGVSKSRGGGVGVSMRIAISRAGKRRNGFLSLFRRVLISRAKISG